MSIISNFRRLRDPSAKEDYRKGGKTLKKINFNPTFTIIRRAFASQRLEK
jgi:hypothetical protein